MNNPGFKMGDSLPVIIVDNEDTPHLTGMLAFEQLKGISLSIPFLNNTPQFEAVRGWARAGKPPANLQLLTGSGKFSLYGCRTSSSSLSFGGSGFSSIRVTPQEVVFKDRDGVFEEALEVAELRSQIDGLTEWTNMGATSYTVVQDGNNRVQKMTVEVEAPPPLTWSHGDVTFELSMDWITHQEEPGIRVREWVCLTTRFETARPCSDHFEEQRKIVALMTLMYGEPVVFRGHQVRDPRFNGKVLTGKIVEVPFYEMVSEDTVADYWRPVPGKLKHPLASVPDFAVEGLERWLAEFDNWQRVIHPAAGTLRRPESYVEDHIVNASVSLEAAGHILGEVEGEKPSWYRGRPTTATFVFRCLSTIDLDWSAISESPMALARAIAGNYNDVKHAKRGPMPPAEHTYVAGKVALLAVRLLALRLVDPTMAMQKAYADDWQFGQFMQQIINMNIYASADGKFGARPEGIDAVEEV